MNEGNFYHRRPGSAIKKDKAMWRKKDRLPYLRLLKEVKDSEGADRFFGSMAMCERSILANDRCAIMRRLSHGHKTPPRKKNLEKKTLRMGMLNQRNSQVVNKRRTDMTKPCTPSITNMLRVIMLIVVSMSLWFPPVVHAQNEALKGEYDLVWWRQCVLEDIGSGSFDLGPLILQGKITFDGVGSGTFTGQTMLPSGQGAGTNPVTDGSGSNYRFAQNDVTGCDAPYVVNADGTFLTTLNNCTLTFTSGNQASSPGPTATQNGTAIEGKISADGTILVLRSTKATSPTTRVETFQLGGDTPIKRICQGHGLATSNR